MRDARKNHSSKLQSIPMEKILKAFRSMKTVKAIPGLKWEQIPPLNPEEADSTQKLHSPHPSQVLMIKSQSNLKPTDTHINIF